LPINSIINGSDRLCQRSLPGDGDPLADSSGAADNASPFLEQNPAHIASRASTLVAGAARISEVRCARPYRHAASAETLNRAAISRRLIPVAIARSMFGRCGC